MSLHNDKSRTMQLNPSQFMAFNVRGIEGWKAGMIDPSINKIVEQSSANDCQTETKQRLWSRFQSSFHNDRVCHKLLLLLYGISIILFVECKLHIDSP